MKFVTFNHTLDDRAFVSVVLFTDDFVHANIGSAGTRAARGFLATGIPQNGNAEPRSAGFFKVSQEGNVTTFGRSESLNLGPMHDDAALIAAQLRF